MIQLDCFRSPPYQRHSASSKAAARAIEPRLSDLQAQVLCCLKVNGPMTDEQMQDVLKLNPSTQRPRRIELVAKALIVDSGVLGKTRSGRKATVWKCR